MFRVSSKGLPSTQNWVTPELPEISTVFSLVKPVRPSVRVPMAELLEMSVSRLGLLVGVR